MSCLVRINKEGNAVLVKEAIKLAPELAYLDEKEALCIIHAYDYESLFRQFAENERQRRALAKVYGKENEKFFDNLKIKKAVQLYRELQYDPIREQIIVLRRKLDAINGQIDKLEDTDTKGLKSLLEASREIRKMIGELELSLNKQDEEEFEEAESKSKLSFLERLQMNRDKYKSMKVQGKKEWNLPS